MNVVEMLSRQGVNVVALVREELGREYDAVSVKDVARREWIEANSRDVLEKLKSV